MFQAEEQKCMGPEAWVCLSCSKKSKEDSRAGAGLERGTLVGPLRQGMLDQIV